MTPFYADNLRTLYLGECRAILAELPEKSVHMCVTSPPYWSQRVYQGVQDLIWGGLPECQHEWGKQIITNTGTLGNNLDTLVGTQTAGKAKEANQKGCFCLKCGAWHGALGLEPTPELFIAHVVEIFQSVKKVLRDDGTLWLNISDSMAGSWGNYGDRNGGQREINVKRLSRDGWNEYIDRPPTSYLNSGIKPLDLCGIPEMLVLALRADGWYWRSTVIWQKMSCMPESVNGWRFEKHKVKVGNNGRGHEPFRSVIGGQDHDANGNFKPDAIWADCPGCPQCSKNDGLVLRKGAWRCTNSFEYVFQLTKTDKYFSDMEAVRVAVQPQSLERLQRNHFTNYDPSYPNQNPQKLHQGERLTPEEAEAIRGRNLRDVWTINPEPLTIMVCKDCYRVFERPGFNALKSHNGKKVCACGSQSWGSHYASFPTELVETCVKASTSEWGVCKDCGSPYARVIENKPMVIKRSNHQEESGIRIMSSGTMVEPNETKTLGWRRTCTCATDERVPAVVLDPFVGSGSTLLASATLGRRSFGIDLSEMYCNIAVHRNKQGVLA